MHFSTLFLGLLGTTSLSVTAFPYAQISSLSLPMPKPAVGSSQAPQAGSAPPAQDAGNPRPNNPNSGNSGTAAANGQRCAADVDRLASGIQQNILNQQGELSSVQLLGNFLNFTGQNRNGTVDGTLFMSMKAQLLTFVTAGIAVRQNNQAIAPPGNPALPGLGQVASAQQNELGLASSLSGDRITDTPTVQALRTAFSGGIRQNMQNLLDATQGCAPSDNIAQRGVQAAQRMGLRAVTPQAN